MNVEPLEEVVEEAPRRRHIKIFVQSRRIQLLPRRLGIIIELCVPDFSRAKILEKLPVDGGEEIKYRIAKREQLMPINECNQEARLNERRNKRLVFAVADSIGWLEAFIALPEAPFVLILRESRFGVIVFGFFRHFFVIIINRFEKN